MVIERHLKYRKWLVADTFPQSVPRRSPFRRPSLPPLFEIRRWTAQFHFGVLDENGNEIYEKVIDSTKSRRRIPLKKLSLPPTESQSHQPSQLPLVPLRSEMVIFQQQVQQHQSQQQQPPLLKKDSSSSSSPGFLGFSSSSLLPSSCSSNSSSSFSSRRPSPHPRESLTPSSRDPNSPSSASSATQQPQPPRADDILHTSSILRLLEEQMQKKKKMDQMHKQKLQQPDAQEEIAQKGQRSFSVSTFDSSRQKKPTSPSHRQQQQPLLPSSASYSPEARIRTSSKKKTAGESLLHSPGERTRALSYSEHITRHTHPHGSSVEAEKIIKVGLFDRIKGLIKM